MNEPPMFRIALAIIAIVVLLIAAPLVSRNRDNLPQITSDIDKRIPFLMAQNKVPGLSIAVVKQDKLVWSKAYGVASSKQGRLTTTDTIFEAASLGKVVFALIILRLSEKGIIDLDEPLANSFQYPILDHDERYKLLTPRLILQHASGLPNWGSFALAEKRKPVAFKVNPGERFDYSGEAYTALQQYIETRTGKSLQELFEELAQEAGMTNSSFVSYQDEKAVYALAERQDGSERPIFEFQRPGAAYSLISTAEDLARFVGFFFHGSKLDNKLMQDALDSHRSVQPNAWGSHIRKGAAINWTLSWAKLVQDKDTLYFHAGNNGEFRSFFAYSPDREVGVALMANSAEGLSFVSDIFKPLVGEIKPATVWWGYETQSQQTSKISEI